MHYMPGPEAVRSMSTDQLRDRFLVQSLFQPDTVTLRAIDLDRVVLGGAVPRHGALTLEAPPDLAAEYFTERREIGVLNIGGRGRVNVDGEAFALERKDGLYIGSGSRSVIFESATPSDPARYYLVSYPAHAAHPTRRIAYADAGATELGSAANANQRRLRKYIHQGGICSAQLVMGITELEEGNVWNTMPPHTHRRRTEVYLYFDIESNDVVFHFLGEPTETRNVIVRDGEVALSPGWSIHAGCGTSRYAFCWAMGGENQDFTDMQAVSMTELR